MNFDDKNWSTADVGCKKYSAVTHETDDVPTPLSLSLSLSVSLPLY